MKTERKFFDAQGKEVPPEEGVTCIEHIINDAGQVVEENVYHAKASEQPAASAAQPK